MILECSSNDLGSRCRESIHEHDNRYGRVWYEESLCIENFRFFWIIFTSDHGFGIFRKYQWKYLYSTIEESSWIISKIENNSLGSWCCQYLKWSFEFIDRMFSEKSYLKISYTARENLFLCGGYEDTISRYFCCYFYIFLTTQIFYGDFCSFWSSNFIDGLFRRKAYKTCRIDREEDITIFESALFCRWVFEYFLDFYSFRMLIYNRSNSFEISLECIFEFSGFFRWEVWTMFISEWSDERCYKAIFHFYFCFLGKVVKFRRNEIFCFFYFSRLKKILCFIIRCNFFRKRRKYWIIPFILICYRRLSYIIPEKNTRKK